MSVCRESCLPWVHGLQREGQDPTLVYLGGSQSHQGPHISLPICQDQLLCLWVKYIKETELLFLIFFWFCSILVTREILDGKLDL